LGEFGFCLFQGLHELSVWMQVPFVNTKPDLPRCAWNCQLFSGKPYLRK
jgi:hypothetical protein